MSMTRKLWSLSALSVEFEMDRRAVARRIDGIAAAGEIKGKPAWHLADVAPLLTDGSGLDDGQSIEEARRRKMAAEARLAEMAAEKAAGRLLERTVVDAAVVGAFARVRAKLLAVPHKCAPLVVGLNAGEASEVIRRAVYEALNELSSTKVSDLTGD
ncbi:hypothetical protein A8B83_00490 [Rhodobacteraceae bacterium EhC02]|nr:hypothetical protein A8B83_00490 [Rhodobacteraceae bacterium EhC02]